MSCLRFLKHRYQVLPLILILTLALGLRLFHNSSQGYSLDESISLLFSSTPGWRSLFWDNHPVFYPILLKVWLWFTPMTEGWTRGLSAVISVGGVYAMAKIGEVNGTKERGRAMALALAFSVVSIHFAQETRMYALFECLSAWHLWSTLLILQADTRRNRFYYTLTLFGLIATHLLGLVPIVLTLGLVAKKYPMLRKQLGLVAAVAGLVAVAVCFNIRWEALQWQWRVKEMIGSQSTIWDLITSYSQSTLWVFALMLISLAALYFSSDAWARSIGRQFLIIFGICWFVFALFLFVTPRNLYVPRYFVFLNPYFIFMFVAGLESLQKKLESRWHPLAGRLLASGFLIFYIAFFSAAYAYQTPAWNQLAQKIISEHGKVVWTTRSKGLAVPYYSRVGINVEQFVYDETTIEKLKIEVAKQDVWFVEAIVGRIGYFEGLNREMIRAGLRLSAFEFDNGYAEPVFAMKVWRDPEAKNRAQLGIDMKPEGSLNER